MENFEKLYIQLSNLLEGHERKNDILRHYHVSSDKVYLPQIVKALQILDKAINHNEYFFNVIKTTRAGYTTNAILAALIRGKKICVVEPTNAIAYDTVKNVMDIYKKITGDKSKIIRQIPSNRDGCSIVVEKLSDFKILEMIPYINVGKCSECTGYKWFEIDKTIIPKATKHKCTIKTLMTEKDLYGEKWNPDIVTITYDKLLTIRGGERGEFFTEMLNKVDIMLFDEVGVFVSNIEQGVILIEEKIFENGDITKFNYNDRKKEILELISKIPYKPVQKIWVDLMKNYITPFIDGTCKPLENKNSFPRYIQNSLEKELVRILVQHDGFKKWEWMPKTKALSYKFTEFYELLESMLESEEEENSESQKIVLWVISLLELMENKMLIAYDTEVIEFNYGEDIKVKLRNMVGVKEDIVKRIEGWMENKTVILTDATMPTFTFDGFNKHVVDMYFGDPLKTNKEMIVYNDKNITTFSVMRWNKNRGYRNDIIAKIISMGWYYGTNMIVWCPNIKIWKELRTILKEREIDTCTHEDTNKEKLRQIMVTYYGSSMTRGVESNRRIQILIGRANKPMGSFKHVAFMQRIEWQMFQNKELEKMASESDMTIEEFKEIIEIWVQEKNIGEYKIRTNKIPEELKKYFEFLSNGIQIERTYMDTWQAGSRAKDPLALNRSFLLCLGWKNEHIWELLKWGSNNSINYVPYDEYLQRGLIEQKSVIAPPPVMMGKALDDIRLWMNGGFVNQQFIGFDVDLQSGIFNMLMHGKDSLTTKEVWLELSKNANVGNNSEKYDNGYMIGTINAFRKFNDFGDDIKCDKHGENNFTFMLNDDEIESKIENRIAFIELEVVCNILKMIFLIEKNKISYRDLRKVINKSVSDKMILRGLFVIFGRKLLDGSTWRIKIKNYSGNITYKIYKNVKHKNTSIIMNSKIDIKSLDYVKRNVLIELINWYEHKNSIDINAVKIKESVDSASIKRIKKAMCDIFKDGDIEKLGLNLKLLDFNNNIIIVRDVAKI